MTNRLISKKIVSWDFVPPYGFAAQFLASPDESRGEQTSALASQKSGSPVWCPLFKNARTFFERNWRSGGSAFPPWTSLPSRPRGRVQFFRRALINSFPCPTLPARKRLGNSLKYKNPPAWVSTPTDSCPVVNRRLYFGVCVHQRLLTQPYFILPH